MSAPSRHHRSYRAARGDRGFTLLELMAAMLAGLFVVLAAFMITRQSTRQLASENRIGDAQLTLRLGTDALRADLERAGFMASPNVRDDPTVCPKPSATGFNARIQAVHYEQGTPARSSVETPNLRLAGLAPDSITLAGNFTSTDSYLVAAVDPNGSSPTITLQAGMGSTARLLSMSETGDPNYVLQTTFPSSRLLRLRNTIGSSQYLVVQSAALGSGNRPILTLTSTPSLRTVQASDPSAICGASGVCMGCEINPVQLMRYSVRSLLTSTAFAWAYPDGDATKYDLIREELRPDGSVFADVPPQIIAEYVVDLGFAFSVDTSAAPTATQPWVEPTLVSYPFDDANNAAIAGDINTSPGARPQRIRSIRYRMSVRSRDADRNAAADNGGPFLSRVLVSGTVSTGTARYARVRTATGEVALINLRSIRW